MFAIMIVLVIKISRKIICLSVKIHRENVKDKIGLGVFFFKVQVNETSFGDITNCLGYFPDCPGCCRP